MNERGSQVRSKPISTCDQKSGSRSHGSQKLPLSFTAALVGLFSLVSIIALTLFTLVDIRLIITVSTPRSLTIREGKKDNLRKGSHPMNKNRRELCVIHELSKIYDKTILSVIT